MNYIKKIGISLLYIFVPIIVLLFIFTLLNYFNIISYNIFKIFRGIIFIIALIIGGFKMGENSNSKGWIEGLKLGLIISIILVIINYLIVRTGFNIKQLLCFGLIIGSNILGSILGINIKKKNS